MKVFKTVVILMAVATWGISGYAATNLPFSADFNDLSVDEELEEGDAWEFVSIAPKGVSGAAEGAAAIYAADGVKLLISDNDLTYSNVWWYGYAKVRAHSEEPSIDGAAAAFYVHTNGQLMAYSNTLYVPVASGIQTNAWIGFAVRLDYGNKVWDLYMNSNYGDPLQKKNTLPLGFRTGFAGNEITAVDVSGETYLDAISVAATSSPLTPGSPSPTNMPGPSEATLTLDELVSGAALQYFDSGVGTLAGPFGEALGSLLVNGDKVHIYDADEQDWVTFTFNGQIFTPADTAAATPITMTTGLQIELAGVGERLDSFFVAYDTPADPPASTPVLNGWNLLSLPFSEENQTIAGAVDFFNFTPEVGDRIFLRRGTQWIALRYSSVGGGRWVRFGTQAANETFPAGSGFWYQRVGVDTAWEL